MKISFLFIFFVLVQISAASYSQTIDLDVRNMEIRQVIKYIEQQSEYRFFYTDGLNDMTRKVDLKLSGQSIDRVLSQLFDNTQLGYRVVDNKLIMLAPKEVMQQGATVTGTVTGPDGSGLPGVSVVIGGTTRGVVTDMNGAYSIVAPPNAVLTFSFIGYGTQEIAVEGRTVVNLVMSEEATVMEEVVVTALGLRRDQKSLGYSTSVVSGKDLNQGASVNMLKSLQGKTTGVEITHVSTDPTASTFVTVRGATSIASISDRRVLNASQPLYVLDGIPIGEGSIEVNTPIDIGNVMSRLNPNDIESVTILKGASAGALYGARAGNGVVMITTKTGAGAKKGTTVSVSSALTFDQLRKTISTQREFLPGSGAENFSMNTTGCWGLRAGSQYANQNWKQWDMVKQEYVMAPLTHTTEDRLKAFMETGHTNTNTVTVTGNFEKGHYRFSYENLNSKGIVPNNQTSRNTFSFNGLYKIRDNLTLSSMASYGRTYAPNRTPYGGNDSRSGIVMLVMQTPPNIPKMSVLKNTPTWVNDHYGILQNTPWLNDNGTQMVRDEADGINQNNPYYVVNEMIHTFAAENFFGKLELDWNAFSFLSFKVRSGVEKNTMNYQRRVPWNNRDRMKGHFGIRNTNSTSLNTDLMAIFNKRFGDFDISAVGGYNYVFSESMSQAQDTQTAGLARPFDYQLGAVAASQLKSEYSWGPGNTKSVYGTASVGWRSMIYLEGTIRKDWYGITERTKASNTYPSVSLSWLANESFNLPDWWTLAKLRGGYAMVGYGIPSEVNANTYGFDSNWLGVTVGRVDPKLIDPGLKPETNTTVEGGFTLGFIDNRINFDFTYFQKVHANQAGQLPIVTSTGFQNMKTNIGEVTSKGMEMALNLGIIRSTDWSWNVGANYSSAKAILTKLRDGFSQVEVGLEGNALAIIRQDEVMGNMYANTTYYRVQSGKFAGQRLLSHSGGAQGINSVDRRVCLGNINPDFTMGFTTDLRYKQFNLNMVATFRYGGMYNSQTSKQLRDEGLTFESFYGDGTYFVGGREGYGGLPWPTDPSRAEITQVRQTLESYASSHNDMTYTVGVFIDPRATGIGGVAITDETLGDGTFTYNGQQLPYYIEQGADPYATLYKRGGGSVSEFWGYAETRAFSATNFRIKEITLSYDIPFNITQKIKCQSAQVAFIARNVFHWNKSGINEDPETAFRDGTGMDQGVAFYNLPYVGSYGVRLTLNF